MKEDEEKIGEMKLAITSTLCLDVRDYEANVLAD